jgi:hypothetical protein
MAKTIRYVTKESRPKDSRSGLYLTDYRELIAELNRVQPTLVGQMKKEYRKIAKPVQIAVKNGIPTEPPTSGRHSLKPSNAPRSGFIPRVKPGRLTWGANYQNKGKRIDAVAIQTPSEKKARRVYSKNKTDAASIARVKVENAGVALADMAGRSGEWVNKYPRTREYDYSRSKKGTRTHKINNQGRGMIKALDRGAGQGASRFAWKSAEKALPKAERDSRQVLNNAIRVINKRMVV